MHVSIISLYHAVKTWFVHLLITLCRQRGTYRVRACLGLNAIESYGVTPGRKGDSSHYEQTVGLSFRMTAQGADGLVIGGADGSRACKPDHMDMAASDSERALFKDGRSVRVGGGKLAFANGDRRRELTTCLGQLEFCGAED